MAGEREEGEGREEEDEGRHRRAAAPSPSPSPLLGGRRRETRWRTQGEDAPPFLSSFLGSTCWTYTVEYASRCVKQWEEV